MASKPEGKPPKIMDVSQPGATPPSSSARPIIVSNRPMLRQDPMMAPVAADGPEAAKPEGAVLNRVRTIAISGDDALSPEQLPPAKSSVTVTAVDPTAPLSGIEADKLAAKNEPITIKQATPVAAMVPAPAKLPVEPASSVGIPPIASNSEAAEENADLAAGDQLAPNQTLEDAKRKQDEAAATLRVEQEKIIASKHYYLPIDERGKRHGTQRAVLVLLLVMLLTLVWLDIVLDAGILHFSGLHSLTHFFKAT